MDDIKYSFFQDVKEKKNVATGSYHKKRGAKSKKCTLYYETLKGKDRKKYMEGTTTVKKLGEIYDWQEYKKLSDEEKKICLEAKGNRYGWSSASVGVSFGVSQSTVYTEIKRLKIIEMYKEKSQSVSRKEQFEYKAKARADRSDFFGNAPKTPVEDCKKENDKTIPETEKVATDGKISEKNAKSSCSEKPNCSIVAKILTPSFFVGLSGKLTGKQLKKRLEGIAKSLDKEAEYSITIDIREGE